ncbi:Ada metal-binding domain-containing protein [Olivibacter jilunii]|jgi:hypothetical protein
MYRHIELGKTGGERMIKLRALIHKKKVSLAGYWPKKIYGLLSCGSGKRMKVAHRVFFYDEQEAVAKGYRPCGHCLRSAYEKWKSTQKHYFK